MIPANLHHKIEFIHNQYFVEWVLKPSEASDQYWKTYQTENPTHQKDIDHARFIIKGLIHDEKSLSEDDVIALWNKIGQTKFTEIRRLSPLKKWLAAASILFLVGLSGWFLTQRGEQKAGEVDYLSVAAKINAGNEIKLILANHSQKTFNSKVVDLKYKKDGKLETKTDKQVHTEELTGNTGAIQMNQLIVPFGKRSSIELVDGTRLWLNSGSRAIYPVAFNGKTREIYIEGEGYLEVAHDATKPFFVVTDQIKVKVLGTKFDVSAYKDDARVSVVLVEGSVLATSASENVVIKPNQIYNYQKSTKESKIEKINVLEYVSWKDGWMLCNKEKLNSITTKLSRYYNVRITCNNPLINSMTLTGKLDLKNNCEDIFKVICSTAPLKYEMIGNTISLTIR